MRITVRSPVAVSYLAQAPGALGLARAYVSGHLDVDGDMFTALSRLSRAQDVHVSPWARRSGRCAALGGPKVLIPRIPPPPQEVVPNRRRFSVGRMHSKDRDAESILTTTTSPTASTSGSSARPWPTPALLPDRGRDAGGSPGVQVRPGCPQDRPKPGMRLLDVGCGWGGMVMHAAREYGVKASASPCPSSRRWAQQAIKAAGLEDLAEVRFHGLP